MTESGHSAGQSGPIAGNGTGNGCSIAETKATNPKDAIGCSKPPLSVIPCAVLFEVAEAIDPTAPILVSLPAPVLFELGLALLEGACKYGRHNYRSAGVRASIYYDAMYRHLLPWWTGEDIDPDSGLSHVTKAIACLVVMRDSMLIGNWHDDRPPRGKPVEVGSYVADDTTASVSASEAIEHLMAWWDGQDLVADDGPSNVTWAIAKLMPLRAAMIAGNWHDDRPPKSAPWMETMKAKAKEILARFPDPLPPCTEAS